MEQHDTHSKHRSVLFNNLRSLDDLPRVKLTALDNWHRIEVRCATENIVDLDLEWEVDHYNVYMRVPSVAGKQRCDTPIAAIARRLEAIDLVGLYKFFHKNRAAKSSWPKENAHDD